MTEHKFHWIDTKHVDYSSDGLIPVPLADKEIYELFKAIFETLTISPAALAFLEPLIVQDSKDSKHDTFNQYIAVQDIFDSSYIEVSVQGNSSIAVMRVDTRRYFFSAYSDYPDTGLKNKQGFIHHFSEVYDIAEEFGYDKLGVSTVSLYQPIDKSGGYKTLLRYQLNIAYLWWRYEASKISTNIGTTITIVDRNNQKVLIRYSTPESLMLQPDGKYYAVSFKSEEKHGVEEIYSQSGYLLKRLNWHFGVKQGLAEYWFVDPTNREDPRITRCYYQDRLVSRLEYLSLVAPADTVPFFGTTSLTRHLGALVESYLY